MNKQTKRRMDSVSSNNIDSAPPSKKRKLDDDEQACLYYGSSHEDIAEEVNGENNLPEKTSRYKKIVHLQGKNAGCKAPPNTIADGVSFGKYSIYKGRQVFDVTTGERVLDKKADGYMYVRRPVIRPWPVVNIQTHQVMEKRTKPNGGILIKAPNPTVNKKPSKRYRDWLSKHIGARPWCKPPLEPPPTENHHQNEKQSIHEQLEGGIANTDSNDFTTSSEPTSFDAPKLPSRVRPTSPIRNERDCEMTDGSFPDALRQVATLLAYKKSVRLRLTFFEVQTDRPRIPSTVAEENPCPTQFNFVKD